MTDFLLGFVVGVGAAVAGVLALARLAATMPNAIDEVPDA